MSSSRHYILKRISVVQGRMMSCAPFVRACPHRLALLFWKRGERRRDYRGNGAAGSEIGRRLAVSHRLRRRAGAIGRLRTALSNVCAPTAAETAPTPDAPAAAVAPPTPAPQRPPSGTPAIISSLTPTPGVPTAKAPAPIPTRAPADAGVEGSLEPPERDLFELAQRLRPSADGPVSRTVERSRTEQRVGQVETFFVADLIDNTVHTVDATLRVVSENAYWYVDNTLDLPIDDLGRAASAYEKEIRPLIVSAFGDIWSPGIDNDPRLTVLHTPLRGVDGYYGSGDEYPAQVHLNSNEREMIYMNGRLKPGSAPYLGVLTHELQHAVQWNSDTGEEAWINEGLSEIAKELAGYRAGFVGSFLSRPTTQLNYWPDELGASGPHYGASTLFLSYMALRFGGYSSLKGLVADKGDGTRSVETYLSGYGASFVDVFKDWVIANYLDEPEGPYSYPDRSVRVRTVHRLFDYGGMEGNDTAVCGPVRRPAPDRGRRGGQVPGRHHGHPGGHRVSQRPLLLVGQSRRLHRHYAYPRVRSLRRGRGDAEILDLVPPGGGLGLHIRRSVCRRRSDLDAARRGAHHRGEPYG